MIKINALVTPFVGVWIETRPFPFSMTLQIVTPFVGVWIETIFSIIYKSFNQSHPSWVCGLKLLFTIRYAT